MGFRDRAWCVAECRNSECSLKLTDVVRAAAREWWGGNKGNPPIICADRSQGCDDFLPVIVVKEPRA